MEACAITVREQFDGDIDIAALIGKDFLSIHQDLCQTDDADEDYTDPIYFPILYDTASAR